MNRKNFQNENSCHDMDVAKSAKKTAVSCSDRRKNLEKAFTWQKVLFMSSAILVCRGLWLYENEILNQIRAEL